MGKLIDISGQKFNKLTAIRPVGRKHSEVVWECECECGKLVNVTSYSLRKGYTKSCGCLKEEILKVVNKTHGLSYSRMRIPYTNMKTRCYNPNYSLFHRYGGRGITVCDDWLGPDGLQNFCDWALANGYDESKTIDRIDNDGGYSPENCRWTTAEVQSNNRISNRFITNNGVTKTLSRWAKEMGMDPRTLRYRIEKGLTLDEIGGLGKNDNPTG